MKKRLLLLCTLLGIAFTPLSRAQVAAGNIDLQQISNNPNNPTGICQCDTIQVRYEIKPGANFSATSTFRYQLANPLDQWGTSIDLSLVQLLTGINPDDPATTVLDTFDTGLKWARLAVPCTASLFGASLRIINEDVNGNITAGGASDTAYYNVNRIPTIATIDSTALISGGVRQDTFENAYTTNEIDIGFCPGDTVVLFVTNDGNSYQWFNGSAMVGTDADSLRVTGSGVYKCEVFDGPCSIMSQEVRVTVMNTPTDINFPANNPANAAVYQMDKPIPSNNSPRDSIEMCITETAFMEGPLPDPNTGLTFTYQWITDSVNPTTGDRIKYPIAGETQANIILDSNNMRPGRNFLWVEVFDGFCTDTTAQPYEIFIDTVPEADVAAIPFPGFTGPTIFNEVCMKDSVLLTTIPSVPDPGWKYQWQWYDRSSPAGSRWKPVWPAGTSDDGFDTLTRITIDTSLSDVGQPYFASPKPSIRYFRVVLTTETKFTHVTTCLFRSDSIAVRWFPEYDITLAPNQPNINTIGPDSISFCEDEVAIISAPSTPADIVANFPQYSYTYEWLTDSVDPNNPGVRIKYSLPGQTSQNLTVDSSGNYFVVLNDGICTDTSRAFRAFVDTLPETQIVEREFPGGSSLTNLNLCIYDSALVSATDTVLGLAPWNYQWQQLNPVSGNWNNLNNDTLVTLQLDTTLKRVGEDTAYFRLLTSYENRFGFTNCSYIADSVQVIFYTPPTISYIPGDSVGICPGDSILFVAQGNFTNFSWQNGQVLGASRYINTPGQYPVEAIGQNSCVTLDTVTVFALTVNAAAGPDQTVLSGEVAQLQAFGGTSYRWFADKPLQFSDMLSQSITVSKILDEGQTADTITIYVEVTNQRGCSGLDSLQLFVRRNIPESIGLINKAYNIFTPNADGLNDAWDIRELMNGDNCTITILNRWGSTVFEEENFSGIWTGVDNGGNDLPDGTYYYVLDCDGEIRMRNAVTIIRNQ